MGVLRWPGTAFVGPKSPASARIHKPRAAACLGVVSWSDAAWVDVATFTSRRTRRRASHAACHADRPCRRSVQTGSRSIRSRADRPVGDGPIGRDRDATQGSERCAGPGRRSPRRNLRPAATRPAHLFAAPCPHGVPPCESAPLRRTLTGRRSPPNDRHREVAVLMIGYFAEALWQPRPDWVAVGLPGNGDRQTGAAAPFHPPGGDCGAAGRRLRFGRSRPPKSIVSTAREASGVSGPWSPCHQRPSIDPAVPLTARETRNPGTRVARRTQFRSKDPQ